METNALGGGRCVEPASGLSLYPLPGSLVGVLGLLSAVLPELDQPAQLSTHSCSPDLLRLKVLPAEETAPM